MKTLKKLASCLVAIVLGASLLALPAVSFADDAASSAASAASAGAAASSAASDATASTAAAQAGTYVFDERGLFDSSQLSTLQSEAAKLADTYHMGVYLLTVGKMGGLSDPSSSQRTNFATNYYKEHKLGLNPGKEGYGDGIMLVVAADSRDYVTIAYGQGSYSFSDAGISKMEDAVKGKLKGDDWYGAAQTYYSEVGSQLAYYDKRGKAQEPLDLIDWVIRLAIVLGIPLLITYFVVNGWRKEMLTAVEQSEAGHYLDQGSLNVIESDDQFVNTTLVATPKPKDNDSDSGWGGGGGGGFSSSGGGKF